MVQILLVGLAAGAAAALLFASVASGSMAAIVLFYLAPLPILIAALGWSHRAGLIAAASATVAIGIVAGFFFVAVPIIAFGAWWLGYLALLARPAPNGGGSALEWYPIGRLVLWAAVIGTLIVAAAIPNFGTDQASLQAGLRKTYERILVDQSQIDLLVIAVPPAAAVFTTIINVGNVWLAARAVKVSGRLNRPWPDLSALRLPGSASLLLAAAIAGSFLPDLVGILSGAFAASLLMVFAMVGFAIVHAVTQGMASRAALLAMLYAVSFLLSVPILAMSALGLADTVFDFRGRVAKRRGPPTPRT